MAKKEGEEIKTPAKDVKSPEEEATPTIEQQLETLQAKFEAETAKTEKAESSAQGLRGSLQEKEKVIREQAGINTRLDGFEETQKILAGMLNERMASGEEIEPEKKTDYLKQFEAVQDKQKKTREDAVAKNQQDEYSRQADAIYARAQAAYGDDEDALFQVRTFLMNGASDLAEKKIAKAEGKTKTVESDEQIYNRMKAQKDKDDGLLKTDNALPAGTGGGLTVEQIEKMSPEDRFERSEEIAKIPMSYKSLR